MPAATVWRVQALRARAAPARSALQALAAALRARRESSSLQAGRRRARRVRWARSARLGYLHPRRARRAATAIRRAACRHPSAAHARQDSLAQQAQPSPWSARQAASARAATQAARLARPGCSRTAAARHRARPAWRVTSASKALQRRCRAPLAHTQAARRWPTAASAPSASLASHAVLEWSCRLLATLGATPHRPTRHSAPSALPARIRTGRRRWLASLVTKVTSAQKAPA